MHNLTTLLQKVKSRIKQEAKPFILNELKDSCILLSVCIGGYFWLPKSEFAKQIPMETLSVSNTLLFLIIVGCFAGLFVNFSNILRCLYTWSKMKWFNFDYLHLSMLDTYSFQKHIKLLPEESKELFETPLSEECLLHLIRSIEKTGGISHDDLQYVYDRMKKTTISENDTFLIDKTKEFFDKNNIDVNAISALETLSVFRDKPIEHKQVMNGKKDLKNIL